MGLANSVAMVVHPHPAMGGDSSHPFVVETARRLEALGATVSTPDLHDPDVASSAFALAAHAESFGAERVLLAGYSWGSVVVSHAAPVGLVARVLVAPPTSMPLGDLSTPTLVLVPENDQYGGPEPTRAALAGTDALIEVVPGADHFLWGHVDAIAERAVAFFHQS